MKWARLLAGAAVFSLGALTFDLAVGSSEAESLDARRVCFSHRYNDYGTAPSLGAPVISSAAAAVALAATLPPMAQFESVRQEALANAVAVTSLTDAATWNYVESDGFLRASFRLERLPNIGWRLTEENIAIPSSECGD